MWAIQAALRAVLVGVSGLPAARAWENRDFTPIPGTEYVAEDMIPVSERPIASGTIEQVGIYQVTVCWPAGSGTKAPLDLSDDIVAAFPPAASIGAVCRVDRSWRGNGRPDGQWYRVPVSIRWRGYGTY